MELGRRNMSSVLVEGGSKIITSLFAERIPDRLIAITAPKIAGKGIEAIGDLGIMKMDDSIPVRVKDIFRKGDDVIIDTRISKNTDAYV
jgi:diaminohydroxyphosphoribosylaminopyrimidine deaminase/5-amino-6-(5-phosphoribosylamino)uracil reductase